MKLQVTCVFFLITSVTYACDCNRIKDLAATQEQSYLVNELIFIGELVESNEDGTYKFRIVELFKGEVQDSIIIGQYQNSCSALPLMTDRTWIVYANPDEKGAIDIYNCGLSRSFETPFLVSEEAGLPPAPTTLLEPKALEIGQDVYYQLSTEKLLEFEMLITEYKQRALKVLEMEIAQLKKWCNR